jgi:hypothetical protein
MKVRTSVMFLLAMICLSACVQCTAPRSCEQISQTVLRSVVPDSTSVERATQRVVDSYEVSPGEVSVNPLGQGEPPAPIKLLPLEKGGDISWRSDGVRYEMVLEGGEVTVARAIYESGAPSASALIQCLGTPASYFARHYPGAPEMNRLAELMMVYPAIGADCWIDKYSAEDPPHFDAGDLVSGCDFVSPGQPDKVIQRLVRVFSPSSAASWMEGQLKSWPEDWRDIVVHTGPLP